MPPSPATGEGALDLNGLSKKFGTVTALDSVSLTVKAGSIHALLGENGAGKTTLMRIAFGMITPDSGSVSVRGRPVKFSSPADAIAQRIGMVHQHFALVPSMSVAENIALGGKGRYRSEITAELVNAIGDRTGLRLDPTRMVSTLTSADRQKLEIIRAFAHDVSILILDEPTTILAEADARDLFKQLRAFADGGGSVVLITHKLRDAMMHADEVTVLRRGRHVVSAPATELTEAAITSAMLGQPLSGSAISSLARPSADAKNENVVVLDDVSIAAVEGIGAITGASLSVAQGEIVGIAALEGSAAVLLRVIAGRAAIASGSISLPSQTKIGFVPEDRQHDAILQDASLVDNIALRDAGHRNGVLDWSTIRKRTTDLIDQFQVRTERPEAAARTLSGGNQQRFVLGRELENSPVVIVLENPAQGLDVQAAAAIRDQMIVSRDTGTAVIFYSSDLDELAELSDRVLVVSNGKLVSVDPDREAIGRALLGISDSISAVP